MIAMSLDDFDSHQVAIDINRIEWIEIGRYAFPSIGSLFDYQLNEWNVVI